MTHATFLIVGLLVVLGLSSVRAADAPADLPDGLYAQVTTPRGVIVGELFYKKVPMTVCSYVGLAEGTLGPKPGTPFFDGTTFHRVVPHFVAQGGSPTPDGEGDAGYEFPDEIVPGLRHDSAGIMQMANAGPDTNSSQWCFMLAETQRLNYNHTVFGRVVRGLEVLPQIRQGDRMQVKILRIGPDAQAFRAEPATFKALVAKAKRYQGPVKAGPDAYFDDPDQLLPTDIPRADDFNRKLGNFLRFTGTRIVARMYARTPADARDTHLASFLETLARKSQVAERGAIAVYFADTDQWHLRVGAASQADFIAGPRRADGVRAPIPPGRTLADALTEFHATVQAQVPVLTEASRRATTQPSPPPLTAAQKLKFQVDAVLDNLLFRLEPR